MIARRDFPNRSQRYARNCSRRMRGAWRAISFSSSTFHHGLKTAPEGDFFRSLMNFSTDLVDITLAYFRGRCRANAPLAELTRGWQAERLPYNPEIRSRA